MSTIPVQHDLIRIISEEMAHGVKTAVDRWMTEIEAALTNTSLTEPGRLKAAHQVVSKYKNLIGR